MNGITLKLPDDSVHNIDIEPSSKIQFSDDPTDYCFTENILSKFEELFLYKYEKNIIKKYEKINPDETIFKQMIIKIGKKYIVLDEKAFRFKFDKQRIYIHNKPCNINTLGVYFLRLFDLYEFDYSGPNDKVNIYQKNNQYIFDLK